MLIDPVCMLTIYPQLLRNFVYKGPNFATISSLLGIVDSLRFVFSRDLMVAEVSQRVFTYTNDLTALLSTLQHRLVILH